MIHIIRINVPTFLPRDAIDRQYRGMAAHRAEEQQEVGRGREGDEHLQQAFFEALWSALHSYFGTYSLPDLAAIEAARRGDERLYREWDLSTSEKINPDLSTWLHSINDERLIDGAGPDAHAEDQDGETRNRANGKEPERQTVQENERTSTTKTVETAKEPVQTSPSLKCTFSRTVVAVDLKRFTDSGVSSVECPDCGRTRSLSPVKGILRFPPHEPRKMQTEVKGKRWSAQGKTDWDMVGG